MSKTITEHEAEFHSAAPAKKQLKAQSRATAKYDQKNGLTPKTYKLPKITVDNFAKVCADNREYPAKVLTRLMELYVKESQS
jgi:hypothetical protein